jgi:phosphodiesterase/alkaline phosphatase D-like protein
MKLGALDISTVKLGTNQVQAVYQGVDLVWQNAPVATAATGVGQTSFTANWNAYTGAVVYLLDVSESSDFSTFVYEDQQVNAPTTSYVVIGLNPNTTYYYRVRASTEALTDPDAQAFFDRVTDAGGSLSTTEQDAVNTLVVQMKDDGIWSS